MKEIAILLEKLIFSNSVNKKIKLLTQYFISASDADKGYLIAILDNKQLFKNIKPGKVKDIIKMKMDSYLFDISYEYVGDLAETIALIWEPKEYKKPPDLSTLVLELTSEKTNLDKYIITFLDHSDINERWAFIKILLGGLRVGVSSLLLKKALSIYGNKSLSDIEMIWNGIKPPYLDLINWLDGKSSIPKVDNSNIFHSLCLAQPFNLNSIVDISPSNYCIEYKWDGIRVQLMINNQIKIYSRSGEDITNSFPEIKISSKKSYVLDGELLVGKNFKPLAFNLLQKRINNKKPSKNIIEQYPAFIKVYDILFDNKKDLRNEKLYHRKKVLENCSLIKKNKSLILSELINFTDRSSLKKIYSKVKKLPNIEGLMIKNKFSLYNPGRKKDTWYKWKKEPKFLDAILMYARRGHGIRSSYYSDFTLGVWKGNKIVPIAKAYSGFDNTELNKLDKFVRNNIMASYGPVKEVNKLLVVELAFDSIQESNRHKSGLSLRFPRFHRIRWDKPINEVLNLNEIFSEFNLNY